MTGVLVVVGAMVGAPLRYLTDQATARRWGTRFPWGILVVNAAGSLLLALLVVGAGRHAVSEPAMAGLGAGFCGALTTYSTFSADTVRLASDGLRGRAVLNVAANLGASCGAASCGALIALALW